ncbi:MAG: alanine--tRNA ligase-related protein [archaeon]
MITRKQLIKKYLDFFKSKGHKEIQNASLIPENDPTTLFISAGMHPLVPYLLGQKHPLGRKVMNIQRCIRTGDIEEVGNTVHHTFFEMIGNWSFGDYWKPEALKWSFEFATEILKLKKKRLAISCFKGDKDAPKDNESSEIWKLLGIPKERIVFLPKSENWWGPAGKTGPCGPDTETFYWKDNSKPAPKKFNPEDENWVEIWNDVLMQYIKDDKGNYNSANQKNVDNGRGLERILAVINNLEDNYLTEIWQPIIKQIERLSKKSYKGKEKPMRIIADHLKASCFIIADGITPSNTEQGYILRRLIRRAIRYGKNLGIENFTPKVAEPVFEIYTDYEHLQKNKKKDFGRIKKRRRKIQFNSRKRIKNI